MNQWESCFNYYINPPNQFMLLHLPTSISVLFQKAKLGVVLGVYLPTIQHIFGVLMFVRLAWIVGNAGTLQSFFMVFMCCLTVSTAGNLQSFFMVFMCCLPVSTAGSLQSFFMVFMCCLTVSTAGTL